jgi:hypothetical protein
MDNQQNSYSSWSILELFGHQREYGFCETVYLGSSCMFRVDVPGLDEREWTLGKPEYGQHTGYKELPVGTKVKRAAVAPRSSMLGVSAIYRMTPCTEEVVKQAIDKGIARPLIVVSLPEGKQLTTTLPGEDGYPSDSGDICEVCNSAVEHCIC